MEKGGEGERGKRGKVRKEERIYIKEGGEKEGSKGRRERESGLQTHRNNRIFTAHILEK